MEFLDVVNNRDEVIGNASYSEIYEKLLPHRIVHVLIYNDKNELALQLRSKHKSFCPGHWSSSVNGHVQMGETYEEAAMREYMEELGVNSKLELLFKDRYDDSRGFFKFLSIFKIIYNGPFKINEDEVEKVEFFTIKKIHQMVESGEKFHPELLFLLNNHIFPQNL